MSRFRSNPSIVSAVLDPVLGTAVEEFLLSHEYKGDSPHYVRELRSYLIGGIQRFGKRRPWKPLLPWCEAQGYRRLSDLTVESLGNYLQGLRAQATVGDYGKVCAILKRLFDYWVREDYLETAPLRIVVPKRLKAEVKVFTPKEIERLRDVVIAENPRDLAIFMLLLDTGMRASEVCTLRMDDFRWERQEVVVRPEVAKNRTFRVVPLSGSLRALQRYRTIRGDDASRCARFFLSFYSTPVVKDRCTAKRRHLETLSFCSTGLTRNGLFFLVKKWGRLASISEARCSPHTFRHFFATQYLKNGGDLASLQRILGHGRLDVTERYLRFLPCDVASQHGRFSPATRLRGRSRHGAEVS